MAPELSSYEEKKIRSFAVLDFETSNLPEHRCNRVGLTELSIYGVATSEFHSFNDKNEENKSIVPPPQLPRVLHKLTLMINPMMAIDREATNASGLDNYMLEPETKFNENAGNLLLSFLKHLQQPVCLVAHNGYTFDFPILKYVFERIQLSMPNEIYVLDSLRAFHDIDELRRLNAEIGLPKVINEHENPVVVGSETDLNDVMKFDARSQNETTPKRPTKRNDVIPGKRLLNNDNDDAESNAECDSPKPPRSRRRLDFGETTPKSSTNKQRRELGKKWYPPKGLYKLSNLFVRTFMQDPIVAHHAEADVKTLTQLMLHYGMDFIDYAEKHAIPFAEIPRLGERTII